MQSNIQSINNTTAFKGGFLVQYPKTIPGIREGFEHIIENSKKLVFENFNGDSRSVMYLLRDSKDYEAAQFIRLNRVKFQYLPEVNTGVNIDPHHPHKLVEYISSTNPRRITKSDDLITFVEAERAPQVPNANRANLKQIRMLMQKLKIEINGQADLKRNGVYQILDKENGGAFVISPKNKFGFRYVFFKPSNKHEHETRFAIDSEGNKIGYFNTPDGIKKFKELFAKATNN